MLHPSSSGHLEHSFPIKDTVKKAQVRYIILFAVDFNAQASLWFLIWISRKECQSRETSSSLVAPISPRQLFSHFWAA